MSPIAENLGGLSVEPGPGQTTEERLSTSSGLSGSSNEPMEPVSMLQVAGGTSHQQNRKGSTLDQYSTDSNAAQEFFKKEPCIHTHRMFERASKIFNGLRRAREAKVNKRIGGRGQVGAVAETEPEIPPLDFRGPAEQKLTFELAFAALKYLTVFEDMLDDCAFFTINPKLKDDEPLVMVVLYDYQSRKFQPRVPFDTDPLEPLISAVEKAVLGQKTKLSACLARKRIRASAPNIEFLLPDKFRTVGGEQKPLPVYAWVNTLKMHPSEVLQMLREDKFTQLWTVPKTSQAFQASSFYLDPHCSDLLVFSPDCAASLQEHALVTQGYLVRQDKSSSLAAHSVVPLVGDEQEVIVVNPGAGFTPAHVAALLKERKGGVVIVSEQRDEDHHRMLRNLELLGASKHVKVIRERFVHLDLDDIRLRMVRAALITADCSKSAIANIVNYVVTEGENLKALEDLSDVSDDLDDRINRLQADHINLLRQALKLNRMQGVTYLTRSVYDQENDAAVQRAIEYVNQVQMARKLRPWRVIPPVIPFSAEEIDEQVGIHGKHASFRPSDMMNGCFVICIAREPEDPREVMARKGLGTRSSKTKVKGDGVDSSDSSGTLRSQRKGVGKKSKTSKPNVAQKPAAGSSSFAARKVAANVKVTSTTSSTSTPTSTRKVPEHHRVVKHPAPFR